MLRGTRQNKRTANNLKACRTVNVLCSFGIHDYILISLVARIGFSQYYFLGLK